MRDHGIEKHISDVKALDSFATAFARGLHGGEVIALSGPLGAGKTTFVQLLGKALGVRERITSPTFTLMHVHGTGNMEHGTKKRRLKFLVHIDAYRLGGAKALKDIGALDYVGRPETVTVVEWAEKVRRVLPVETTWIDMVIAPDGTSRILRIDRAS